MSRKLCHRGPFSQRDNVSQILRPIFSLRSSCFLFTSSRSSHFTLRPSLDTYSQSYSPFTTIKEQRKNNDSPNNLPSSPRLLHHRSAHWIILHASLYHSRPHSRPIDAPDPCETDSQLHARRAHFPAEASTDGHGYYYCHDDYDCYGHCQRKQADRHSLRFLCCSFFPFLALEMAADDQNQIHRGVNGSERLVC